MNLIHSHPHSRAAGRVTPVSAFTLTELLVAVSVFLLLLIAIVGATIFGMKWFQISQTKLLASDSARKAIGRMTDEIRTCNSTYVGYVDTNGIFVGCTNGAPQVGSSLLIYPTTNTTTNYILYFLNPADETFRRTSTASGLTSILTQTVTNTNIFQVEDYLGVVQSNNTDSRVIRCLLQFYQTAPNSPVADSYTLDTVVTKRAL